MTMAPMFDDVYGEVHPGADDVTREVYGPLPAAPKRKLEPAKFMPGTVPPRRVYMVTSDARIMCSCGHYVYTERRNGQPPAFPDVCWHCLTPLPGR